MNKQLTNEFLRKLAIVGLLIGFGIQFVQAAPVYNSKIFYRAQGIVQDIPLEEGTTYAYANADSWGSRPGNSYLLNDYGEASISNNRINLRGYNGVYNQWGLEEYGSVTFEDLVFRDINNPGGGGSTSVQVNYHIESSGNYNSKAIVELGNSFGETLNPSSGTYTHTFAVDLDTAVTLSFSLLLINAHGGSGLSNASMWLSPFTLEDGITLNSVDAGIVNNTISSVPVPASIWLMGSGLIGLIGVTRRRKRR